MNNKLISQRGETFFLNLRFLLIVCVFVGNAIEPMISEMHGINTLYLWIFSFHMPLFVFVTGYFARNNLRGNAGRKLLLQIAFQYAIFQTIYSILDYTVFQVKHIQHSFFAPYLLLWFLVSHLCWRLLLIFMHKMKAWQQLSLSITLGVLVGYLQIDGNWLSLSRTFVYLPFFIAGYHFCFENIQQWFTKHTRLIALTSSLGIMGVIALWGQGIPAGWLYGSMTYTSLAHYEWYAGVYRLALYFIQFVASLTFFFIVPLMKCWLTDYGRRTLYVFLLHGIVVRFAVASPIYKYIHTVPASLAVIGVAIILTLFLCHPVIRRLTSPIIEPPVTWMITLERRAFANLNLR